jgi:zinc transport system substrate-binding protein
MNIKHHGAKKRKLNLFIIMVISATMVLTGCSTAQSELVEGKVNVITSFYPLYDFTTKIGGEHVNVINLIPAGLDSHDWSPKTQDMKNITNADLLIYNGLGFEGWVDDFLDSLEPDSKLVSVEASHGISLIPSSEEEGHVDEHAEEAGHVDEHAEEAGHEDEHAEEAGHEEQHAEEAGHEDEHGHGDYDPHVWLSPLQAIKIAENIKNALIEADAANKADYEANYDVLFTQLDGLHQHYEETISAAPRNEIVVSHQAYGYLARDYGLQQVAVMGLSPDAEPTSQDMKEILDFVEEHDVKYILFEELVSPKLAETLADQAKIETIVFNPLEGLTEEQLEAGEDYISMMERNLTSLHKALQ